MTPAEKTATGTDGVALSSYTLLDETIKSMREGVIVVAPDGAISSSNPAARALFGEGIERQRLSDIIPQEKVRLTFERAFAKGDLTELQVEIPVRADNRIYDMRVAPLNFSATGKPGTSAIGIFYDVTRLERLELQVGPVRRD